MYDYTAGEADWFAAGLPIEGKLASVPRAQDVARRDVPTCGLSDQVGAVRERVRAAGWDQCIVVNEERVVMGRLRQKELGADDAARVETAMELGPTTIRRGTVLEMITERLAERNVESIVVATSAGQLVGVLYRADAQRRLANAPDHASERRTGMATSLTNLSELLHEVAETHHVVWKITDGTDPDWASWYADHLLHLTHFPELIGKPVVRSELVYLLVKLDKDYTAQQPSERWEDYYARNLIEYFAA